MKTDKRYWFVLIIPIAAIIAIAVFLIPGMKHHDWDDDDDEKDEKELVEGGSAIENIDDELLNSFNPDAPFHQTGHSQPFTIHPREDITVSAGAGAFERDVTIRVTDVPAATMDALDRQLEGSGTTMLFAYDLDAGLPSDSVIPGKYTVSIDLEKHGIPEELYPYFVMYRVAGDGRLQPLDVRIDGHTATYQASQNSITFAGIAFLLATLGTGAWVTYARFPAIMQTARRMADAGIWPSNWWKWDDAVYRRVTDEFGNFYVCYRYSMTEMGDKTEEYVEKKNELIALEDKLRKKAIDKYVRENQPVPSSWLTNALEEEKHRIGVEEEFMRLMAKNERVKELADDPVLQTPQSVEDIIKAERLANRYCRSVQQMKPLSYEYVVYLTPAFDAFGQEAFRHQTPILDPIVVVNYSTLVVNGKYEKETVWKIMTTMTHETMHVYQMEYVACSLFKNDRYLEATGALVEHHYAAWLAKKRLVPFTDAESKEADDMMGYTRRDKKVLLSSPLDYSYPDYQGISLVQCEGGYMLADLLQYLIDNIPNGNKKTFADMMNGYAVNKGLLKSLEDIFGIADHPSFVNYFEGFCQKYINDIETCQYAYSVANPGDKLVMEKLYHDPAHPVMRVKKFGYVGSAKCYAFMVKTFRMIAQPGQNSEYNLFAVPSRNVQPTEMKFTFFTDSGFTADHMCFNPVFTPNSYCRISYAALMSRPAIEEVRLDDYYYDVVAFYAPKEKPETEMVSGGGVRMKTYELPSDELMRSGYVTGIAYTVKNNKTGRENTVLKTLVDPDTPVIAIPDYQAGEETDITTYCRWYYKPYDNESTIYYSPKSDIEMASGREENVLVDETFRITSMIEVTMWDENSQEMRRGARFDIEQMRRLATTAHLIMKPDGTFSLSIKPLQASFSKTGDNNSSETESLNISGVEIEGKGDLSRDDNWISLAITSMTCSTISERHKGKTVSSSYFHESYSDYKYELLEQQAALTYSKNGYGNVNRFAISLKMHQTGTLKTRYDEEDPMNTLDFDETKTMEFEGVSQ